MLIKLIIYFTHTYHTLDNYFILLSFQFFSGKHTYIIYLVARL